jgi:hypothetical protein
MTLARRILISVSLLLTSGLFIEVYLYHPAAITARDPWAAIPIFWAALTLPVASLSLFRPTQTVLRIFAILCGLGVLVGLAGLGFHLSLHSQGKLASFLSGTTWLGDPPSLAPLEFLVASFFGLLGVTFGTRADPMLSALGRAFRIVLGIASAVAIVAAITVAFGAARSPLPFVLILGLLTLGSACFSVELIALLVAPTPKG